MNDGIDLNRTTLNDFEIIEDLGKGSIGKVKLAEYKQNGHLYALKFIKYKHRSTVLNGIKLSMNFDHPNLLHCYGSFIDSINNITYIIFIMEFFQGRDLYDVLSNDKMTITTDDIKPILTQIVDALKYLHDLKIIHRDIKLDNIVININGHIKLIDYDFLTTIDLIDNDRSGTPFYVSPEVLNGKMVDQRTDLWSLGVVLYILLTGDYPFYARTDTELYDMILTDEVDFRYVPEKYMNIVKGLLTKDRNKRIKLEHLHKLLKDL